MTLFRPIISRRARLLALGARALVAAEAGSPVLAPAHRQCDPVVCGYLVSVMDCSGCHTPGL